MPPKRKNPHILRSGNAGNSAKSTPASGDGGASPVAGPSTSTTAAKPQLFPPGSKTPIALLNERCQKNGWEKPLVDPRRHKSGFTASVVVRKRDKKEVSKMHEVKLEPFPWLSKETALEAKHWAATYALHRFSNSLPLYRVLPPGPKEYWLELDAAQKNAEDHRQWEYADDPFAAKAGVEARQKAKEVRLEKEEVANASGVPSGAGSGHVPKIWQRAPELKMPVALRDSVEAVVRRHLALLSESTIDLGISSSDPSFASSSAPGRLAEGERDVLQASLVQQGFRKRHAFSAVTFVDAQNHPSRAAGTSPSDALRASLARLPAHDAALQYLMLIVPEDDLPNRFRPTARSQAFVTGTRAHDEELDLSSQWAIDRLVKEQGFPRKAAEELYRNGSCEGSEDVARDLLGRRLAGWEEDGRFGLGAVRGQVAFARTEKGKEVLLARDEHRAAELQALEAMLGPERLKLANDTIEIAIPTRRPATKDWLALRVHLHPLSLYPSSFPSNGPALPTLSIVSSTLPAYLRLGLLKAVLEGFQPSSADDDRGWEALIAQGEGGIVYEVVQWLEEHWERIVDDDPPDVGDVMKGFLPSPSSTPSSGAATPPVASAAVRSPVAPKFSARPLRRDASIDVKLAAAQRAYLSDPSAKPMLDVRKTLPAFASRSDFLACLASSSRVVVVAGETGSGKTTQLPQYVLDDEIERGKGSLCSIVVTQPRRVSAIGVATRVAQERGEDVERRSGTVGYAIRGERRAGPHTKLLFATTGVVLRRLATGDPDLKGVSHIFVDEVHERSVDSDLLLLELKKLLSRNKHIRIILMSATANQAQFAEYFGGAASLQVSGRTFPVEDLYAEDFIDRVSYNASTQSGGKSSKHDKERPTRLRDDLAALNLRDPRVRILEALSKGGRTDENLVAAVVRRIVDEQGKAPLGAVLVFMSGVAEIRGACDAIASACGPTVECLPLHSQLSGVDQRKVFEPPRSKGRVKVVVATNIAETSITIPDVVYVVDSGREKQTAFDPETGLTRLVEVNCSRAAAKQRRGRAGRTCPGVCYKLFTRARERDDMANETKAEILRTPLESLFLQVKAMREAEDVHAYLGAALTPPPQTAMDHAVETLVSIGALDEDGRRLTALGKHLAQLPMDVRLAKLLVFGCIFGVLDPTLSLSAILSAGKPLFAGGFERREEISAARRRFARANSDLLTDVEAYTAARAVLSEQGFRAARDFCQENQISVSTFREANSLRQELLGRLQECGFVPATASSAQGRRDAVVDGLSDRATSSELVKSVFMSGLSQVVRIERPQARFERLAGGAVEKDADAKAVKFFDPRLGRVFLHPGSILFDSANQLKDGFLSYFSRSASGPTGASKVLLRDASEIPLFGVLLLYGGSRRVTLDAGGLSLGPPDALARVRAPLRIGVLANALRQMLDAVLNRFADDPYALFATAEGSEREIVEAVCGLIA